MVADSKHPGTWAYGDWSDEPVCVRCGYDLKESLQVCPECGTPLAEMARITSSRKRTVWLGVIAIVLALFSGVMSSFHPLHRIPSPGWEDLLPGSAAAVVVGLAVDVYRRGSFAARVLTGLALILSLPTWWYFYTLL